MKKLTLLEEWRIVDNVRELYEIVDETVVNDGKPHEDHVACIKLYLDAIFRITGWAPVRILSFIERRWNEGRSYRSTAAELMDEIELAWIE